ncbi:hypothetical protein L195_g055184, partial [Trifolium pratense]
RLHHFLYWKLTDHFYRNHPPVLSPSKNFRHCVVQAMDSLESLRKDQIDISRVLSNFRSHRSTCCHSSLH